MMTKKGKIFVAGHKGLVGSALVKNLKSKGYSNLITRTRKELDLSDNKAVGLFFETEKPEWVFLAAAKVGGIVANNKYRADFLYENLMIQSNVIHHSYLCGVKKLMFLGSTCIYPKKCPQPMKEDYLLTDILEYTNEPYAIAKIAGIKLCESYNLQYGTNFISVMPTNLYGPNDNFDLEKSHVLPALIRKMYLGKALENDNWSAVRKDLKRLPLGGIHEFSTPTDLKNILKDYGIFMSPDNKVRIEIWGSGKPMREFIWSEDMADACTFIMEKVDFSDTYPKKAAQIRNTHINIGTGKDISIRNLALKIKNVIGFEGELFFNPNKPDGTMKKLTDPSKLNRMGWIHSVELDEGIVKIHNWYKSLN